MVTSILRKFMGLGKRGKLKGPERARNGIRGPERVGGKPERAARGHRVPGME